MHPLTSRLADSVASLGEERLIARIRQWLGHASPPPPLGIGDDCALLPASSHPQLITVDPVIFNRHFDHTVPPRAVGEKLLKRNLSDIAAMGGRPRAAVVALALDARTSLDWIEAFYRGLASTARKFAVQVVGGDVAEARGVVAASLTLVGEATAGRVLTRRGAKIGDWILVTGKLGLSTRTGHHYRFTPRLKEGAWLATQPAVRSMMDVSDGLAKDLPALTPSGAAAALDANAIPRRPRATLRHALGDGEDYELLFTVEAATDPGAFIAAWHAKFPHVPLACVGRFVRRNALPAGALNLDDYRGYEHLR